jgi:UDP-N-acetylmuramate: L-alanyl-gamma-D-glutamyl-meso-diaminopimelate ligase
MSRATPLSVRGGREIYDRSRVFRSTLPEAERLSVDELVRDVSQAGRHARCLPDVDAIVATIAREAQSGDLVVIMSNGGFGGIHDKLLDALAA